MSTLFRFLVAVLIAGAGFAGVAHGAGAQERPAGIVTILKYYCTYLEQTMLLEAIDPDACEPGAATFTFYFVGDGTNEFQQLNIGPGGEGTIQLAAGDYEIVEEGSQAHFMVTVVAGQTVQLLVGNPGGDPAPEPQPDPTGTVTIQKYYCTYLEETLLVEAIDEAECSPGAATFSFYLVGDGTNDFEQLTVGAHGGGLIELPAGSYEMVEEGSQTFFNLTVLGGENTHLLIGNPAADVAPPAPAPTTVPAQPVTPKPTQAAPAPVAKLPNTGSGVSSGSAVPMVTLALVATAAMAGVGALTVRKMRSE